MLTQPQVQRYSIESGLRDIMIAEKEVVLTFLLQLLSERGILDRLAFKGGTCLRKMFVGSQGRFSTDLDFTGTEEHDHEDVILDMMEAFEQPFHGIQFAIPDDSYYETQDGLSWGVNPTYSHDWNRAAAAKSSCRSAAAKRRRCRRNGERRSSRVISGSCRSRRLKSSALRCPKSLPRKSAPAISATRRATSTTSACSPRRPLDQALIRRLVVLKLWQARDTFDPARLIQKFEDGRDFDWDDLRQLLNRAVDIDRDRITADCVRGFGFLADLTDDEHTLARDQYQREQRLRKDCARRRRGADGVPQAIRIFAPELCPDDFRFAGHDVHHSLRDVLDGNVAVR